MSERVFGVYLKHRSVCEEDVRSNERVIGIIYGECWAQASIQHPRTPFPHLAHPLPIIPSLLREHDRAELDPVSCMVQPFIVSICLASKFKISVISKELKDWAGPRRMQVITMLGRN